MHKSNQLSNKKLKLNNKTLIGFKYHDVYNNKQLFKLLEYSTQINGLIYYNINDLPKSIINFIK
jgi:hypothetical protein